MTPTNIPLNRLDLPETLWWDRGELYLLDQTRLPLEVIGEHQETIEQVHASIRALKVRGAPAIGVAAAYGLLVGLESELDRSPADFIELLTSRAEYLNGSRPTAVNLRWGLDRMLGVARENSSLSTRELHDRLVEEAIRIHDEDRELCRSIGEHGAPLIRSGQGVLTHCNAGSLATSEFGTATSPMYVAHREGVDFRVYADETRPLLQGARLTAWELQRSGIDVTLITDNTAAHLMSKGLIDLVITGADRVAANGDVANKIGTLGVAILARHFELPLYVAIPYSTIDFDMPTGEGIPIEERDPAEVTSFGERRTAPPEVQVRSPAFDVTPHELVAGLITERGLVFPPFEENLRRLYEDR